jgi:hypothetical protein
MHDAVGESKRCTIVIVPQRKQLRVLAGASATTFYTLSL